MIGSGSIPAKDAIGRLVAEHGEQQHQKGADGEQDQEEPVQNQGNLLPLCKLNNR